MNILITAGGTSEKIDNVRSITNHSTGRLGKIIAETFLAQGHHVTYVTTAQAVRPAEQEKLTIVPIETTKDLQEALLEQFDQTAFDSVIHSMAVSDFTTETTLSEEEFIEQLSAKLVELEQPTKQQLKEFLHQGLAEIGETVQDQKKIPSKTDRLLLFLKKNPKIIAMLREKQPQAIVVGFKLLVGVSEEELIQVGQTILEKNHCDFILANDLETIQGDQHKGILIDATGQTQTAQTKAEIARLIVENVENKWRNKK
ncbi:phosphopantothenate--cysteine ligase [Enterococcus sp. DIV0242_7C1]|uniref:Phosphopantothenate-cysteine ligase n=1 Tax=Candidatus Enterococcus dunnyi TaxID=1834192 RepID=A0A200JCU1_9ENTE|nr:MULTISPECIES: phosphopantothenate--cysteine ligase [unclassified Enterococcus]MBO0469676.1 phosphopantothenate--cysteine ligase [Enterococcus sp. DIV0242_7C1]OUZ35032.1 phosphopantothenate-cysteine ligase [Enterococcus sp. 9D6_DIV0238]